MKATSAHSCFHYYLKTVKSCDDKTAQFYNFFREIALCSKRRFDESFLFSILIVSNWRNFTFLENFRETDWFVNEFLQQIDFTKYFRSKSTIQLRMMNWFLLEGTYIWRWNIWSRFCFMPFIVSLIFHFQRIIRLFCKFLL